MKSSRGYTLIEVLIAMIIFAVISTATGFAVSAALKSQQAIRIRTDELQEARTVLNVISRDLRGAYASAGNPATLFIASGNYSGTLLTFSTLAHKVVDPNSDTSTNTNSTDQIFAPPQSDLSIVQYTFTPETGQLSRTEAAVPNPDALGDPTRPETILSKHVHSISLQYLVDPTTGFRQDWNYVTQQQQSQSGTAGTTQTGAQATGDTTLPQSVQVQIEFINSEGIPRQYSTVVMLPMAAVQPVGQKPEAAIQPLQPSSAGGGGQGGGGQGGGGQGGGNSGGGNTGGPRPGGSLPGVGGGGMLGRP